MASSSARARRHTPQPLHCRPIPTSARLSHRRHARNIWLLDIGRNVEHQKFTFNRAPGGFPGLVARWRPHRVSDGPGLVSESSSETGEAEVLLKSPATKTPTGWSRDGRYLLYTETAPKTGDDISILPLDGDRKPIGVLRTASSENQAAFSPDMR